MSKSWPAHSSSSPQHPEVSEADSPPARYETSHSDPVIARLGRNWHLIVLPGLMGLMLWMITSLLWPQPQAEITLKPLQANGLSDAYTLPAEETPALGEEIGEEMAAVTETEPQAGAESESVSTAQSTRKKHARPKAFFKKSAHPPVTNLNTASLAQLQRLPGIGPKMAQRIVEYRKAHGAFASPEQVMDVKGIGPKKFEKLKAFLKV